MTEDNVARANLYRWRCQICDSPNPPESILCSTCQFPAESTAKQIDAARKAYADNKPVVKMDKEVDEAAMIIGFILIGLGGLLLKLFFWTWGAVVGFVLIMIGALVVDLSGYTRKKNSKSFFR